MDYFEKYMELNKLSARMTGYFSAKAMHDSSIPPQAKKEMLRFLIEVWKETYAECDVTKRWIKEWEEDIKSLPA
tara:strand:- start:2604 stop:2825 length:222 start_codon:yes stop_codon:yes gene_type:complete